MKIIKIKIITLLVMGYGLWVMGLFAQEGSKETAPAEVKQEMVQPKIQAKAEEQTAVVETLLKSENVTLDFKEADIRNVLKILSYKSGMNIVATPEVMGNVSIRLVNVPWEKALDVILKTYGFAYEKIGNIITVAPIDKFTALKKQEVELAQVQPTITEVFRLKYIDAIDAKKALEPQLSPRGKITVLEMTGQSGWEFGTTELTKRKRIAEEKMVRSKTIIISDIPPVLDKIREVIAKIDIKPKQILIETKLVEVNRDKLKDIGFDWGTGSSGVSTIGHVPIDKKDGTAIETLGTHAIGTSGITPSVFGPEATGLTPTAGGLELIYRKLTGTQFEAILYALEEDVDTNTLSAPRIMALDNQEATILVGTKYPILKSEESTQSAYTVSKSLDYYQDIGIQLNVVPQISGEDSINMIVHPAVTSTTSGVGSQETAYFPIIDTREAETRVLMKDGETVVIGGLLKDVKSKSQIGIPFFSKIPILGIFFRRDTVDTSKIDLLIFITAHIIKEGEFTAEEIAKLEERLERGTKKKKR
ncbi:MAG: type IV pilus secretin PilQ [Candidatus Omnitrophica bacterium]|nr:type IV pilus secretin PilQ [Candidatus Omnitrophota bacterium]